MNRFITYCLVALAVSSTLAQQQSKTIWDSAGNKTIMDVKTGWTLIMKDGKTEKTAAADVDKTCEGGEKWGFFDEPGNRAMAILCDEWWKLQPKTEIERVPFQSLVQRLLLYTRTSATFVRYRGMELKSSNDSTTYDAVIVPSDVGSNVSCVINEEDRSPHGMLYIYDCTIKTDSFPAAIQLKERLEQNAKALGLKEDEVREHGLAAHAKEEFPCAPGGECLEQNVYATVIKDWKNLQIQADPVFTSNVIAEAMASEHGGHAAISGIASNEGTVSFQIFSVGSKNPE
jgi:hypothetical protein